MARGKHKARAENRRAHLDNEVMQQLKDENKKLNSDLMKAKQDLQEQRVKHEREIAHEVDARTKDFIARAKESIEFTEEAARVFVRARTEALFAYCAIVLDSVPGQKDSFVKTLTLMRENGVEDYEEFWRLVLKNSNGRSLPRYQRRIMNIRSEGMVREWNRYQKGGVKQDTLEKMREVMLRHEQET